MSAVTENITSQTEDFLQAIYRLQERNGVARTGELVKTLKVVPGTVTNTVERLEKRGLVTHEAYRGVKLTEEGKTIALRVLRRHRLSERLLLDILGMEWNQVHEAACRLEHGVTNEVAKSIEKVLEWPRTCPHGKPIPTGCGGIVEEAEGQSLLDLQSRDEGVVTRIADEKRSTVEMVAKLGLKPGTSVRVLKRASRDGPIIARIGRADRKVSARIASVVRVKKLGEGSHDRSEVER